MARGTRYAVPIAVTLIRAATDADLDRLWPIFGAICRAGETLAQDETTTKSQFRAYWLGAGGEQHVATDAEGGVLGGYTLRPNQPGRGAHVGTATYVVDEAARGRGIGRLLGEHSIERARAMGFAAMQFNLVVSTNEGAVALWRKLGFTVTATLPRVFRHPTAGLVDAFVMTRIL